MAIDKWFAVKIALFNSLGFSYITAGVTYVDARLTTHVVYGPRHYRAGYTLSVIGGLLIFAGTMLVILKTASWRVKAALPAMIFAVMSAVALPFFRPEFPHQGMSSWTLQLSLVCLLSCVIHFLPFGTEQLSARDISVQTKLERVKEHANLWRTIAISVTVGYIAVIIPWSNFIWSQPSHIVANASEAFLLSQSASIALAILSLYMLFGVVYEAFLKAHRAADLMFHVQDSENHSGQPSI
ncbi:MAG TPA: hypothetical protein VE842_01350 [Pyrinomonadaceae bacterium]|nr:hypothetical protein [Pyrinomonadaceae bacterium]